jgi:hypothetical protein
MKKAVIKAARDVAQLKSENRELKELLNSAMEVIRRQEQLLTVSMDMARANTRAQRDASPDVEIID